MAQEYQANPRAGSCDEQIWPKSRDIATCFNRETQMSKENMWWNMSVHQTLFKPDMQTAYRGMWRKIEYDLAWLIQEEKWKTRESFPDPHSYIGMFCLNLHFLPLWRSICNGDIEGSYGQISLKFKFLTELAEVQIHCRINSLQTLTLYE